MLGRQPSYACMHACMWGAHLRNGRRHALLLESALCAGQVLVPIYHAVVDRFIAQSLVYLERTACKTMWLLSTSCGSAVHRIHVQVIAGRKGLHGGNTSHGYPSMPPEGLRPGAQAGQILLLPSCRGAQQSSQSYTRCTQGHTTTA